MSHRLRHFEPSEPACPIIPSISAGAGTAHIRFSLAKPQAMAMGELALELDPLDLLCSIFANITAVTAFDAASGAYGFATVNGKHVDVQFRAAPETGRLKRPRRRNRIHRFLAGRTSGSRWRLSISRSSWAMWPNREHSRWE
jgi:hypothetical protein